MQLDPAVTQLLVALNQHLLPLIHVLHFCSNSSVASDLISIADMDSADFTMSHYYFYRFKQKPSPCDVSLETIAADELSDLRRED